MSTLNFENVVISDEIPETLNITDATAPEQQGEPKKKRGRPKKDAITEPKEKKPTEPKVDIFEQLKKDIEDNKSNINPSQEVNNLTANTAPVQEQKSVINGYMLLLIADLFFPALIKIIFKKAAKDIKIQELTLSDYQKGSLEPLADAVASQVLGYIDPLTLFFIVVGGTYYQNFETIKDAKSNFSRR